MLKILESLTSVPPMAGHVHPQIVFWLEPKIMQCLSSCMTHCGRKLWLTRLFVPRLISWGSWYSPDDFEVYTHSDQIPTLSKIVVRISGNIIDTYGRINRLFCTQISMLIATSSSGKYQRERLNLVHRILVLVEELPPKLFDETAIVIALWHDFTLLKNPWADSRCAWRLRCNFPHLECIAFRPKNAP